MKSLIAISMCSIFSGCSALPICSDFRGTVVRDSEGSPYLMINEQNLQKLGGLLHGLNSGTCRLKGGDGN